MYMEKEKCLNGNKVGIPTSRSQVPSLAQTNSNHKPKLFVPIPFKFGKIINNSVAPITKLSFSSICPTSRLIQLSNLLKNTLGANSQMDASVSDNIGEIERKNSEMSFLSHNEDSAFKLLDEELFLKKKLSVPLLKQTVS